MSFDKQHVMGAAAEAVHAVIYQAEINAGQYGVDIMDADAVDRYRDMWRGKNGHDMAPINYNSLRRFVALVDHLALEASSRQEERRDKAVLLVEMIAGLAGDEMEAHCSVELRDAARAALEPPHAKEQG